MFVVCLLFLLCWLTNSKSFAQNHSDPIPLEFDYREESPIGPLQWNLVDISGHEWEQYVGLEHINLDVPNNECASIRRPAPINLVANAECFDTHEILTRKIRPTDCKLHDLDFTITSHTLRATFPQSDSYCERPTIDLPNGYPFAWFIHHIEVHIRAEHVLDGRRYDGEMQMFHLGQQDQKREMATVSVMLDASGFEDDTRLQEYIVEWQRVERETLTLCALNESDRKVRRLQQARERSQPRERKLVERLAEDSKDPSDPFSKQAPRRLANLQGWAPRRKMFPYSIWPTIYFYRYKGSLTAPPCSEIVSWRVLDEPLVISRSQWQELARLLHDYVDPETCQNATLTSNKGENARPMQQLNNEKQELVHCTERNFGYRLYPPNMI
mmetsp:Transcript_24980/g.58179  ORF Transcript_24980/g.58179 Transcript_24980/m.58179 type:complete len:384 (+) Transcript_24980:101-1252(+)|eukprot:CAMPEP_0116835692 /NCGR_PEP_ID=MMETSP0418-20121206/7685_1 /TAXON_ID=1158023 /ORGANISM="Astrosyne radiata, Strain 13vi08-1A" /LENGTH=383 /DNA_ID=CAMNT_0004465385 /DNA_START=459 /DNA_END=1610 /DNA_ORIENTATION=+